MLSDEWFKEQGKMFQKLRKSTFPNDTQETFAKRVGVSRNSIQNIEAGSQGVSWGVIVKALSLFDKKTEVESLFQIKHNIKKLKEESKW